MAQLRKLMNEALDAGACAGRRSDCLDCGNATQRDFDGTPMPTIACLMRRRSKWRRSSVSERGLHHDDAQHREPEGDWAHQEELCAVSGRPLLYNAVAINDDKPNRHRRQLAWLEECRKKGLQVIGQESLLALYDLHLR